MKTVKWMRLLILLPVLFASACGSNRTQPPDLGIVSLITMTPSHTPTTKPTRTPMFTGAPRQPTHTPTLTATGPTSTFTATVPTATPYPTATSLSPNTDVDLDCDGQVEHLIIRSVSHPDPNVDNVITSITLNALVDGRYQLAWELAVEDYLHTVTSLSLVSLGDCQQGIVILQHGKRSQWSILQVLRWDGEAVLPILERDAWYYEIQEGQLLVSELIHIGSNRYLETTTYQWDGAALVVFSVTQTKLNTPGGG